jgi:hypothetical protein
MPNFRDIDHPWILRRLSERDRRDWIEMTYIARTTDSPLVVMKAMSRMKDLLNAYLEAAVGEARERGASWGDIAEALGRSRQAVHKQYGAGEQCAGAARLAPAHADPARSGSQPHRRVLRRVTALANAAHLSWRGPFAGSATLVARVGGLTCETQAVGCQFRRVVVSWRPAAGA